MADTLRPQWPAELIEKAAAIRLLALDVDGIMTDGTLLFSASGDEMKGFNILDGLGIKQVMAAGINVAVITGRRSPLTEKRMNDLGIPHLMQGREDKKIALRELAARLEIAPHQIAYMGDDLPDLPGEDDEALPGNVALLVDQVALLVILYGGLPGPGGGEGGGRLHSPSLG